MNARTALVSSVLAGSAVLLVTGQASAQTVIKNPGDHPDNRVELDVPGAVAPCPFGYHGRSSYGRYSTFGTPKFGAAFYAAIKIADPAFIPSLNNTVGILFGFDVTNCAYCSLHYGFRLWTPV